MRPRDFLGNPDEINKPLASLQGPKDFLAEPVQEQEDFSKSALLALPKISEDLLRGSFNAFRSIPGYYESAQTAIPEAYQDIKNNPMSALKQGAAGIPELGHNLLNIPHNLSQYGTNRLNLIPKDFTNQVPYQGDIEQDINQLFGAPKNKGEELIRGITRNLDTLIPATKFSTSLVKMPINAMRSINPEKVALSIQKSHDKLLGSAEKGFEKVGKEAVNRGVNQVPIRTNLIADITDHPLIPNTDKMKDILLKASSGDYQGLRDLQSELFHRGNRARKSILESEKVAGEKLLDLRKEINNSIHNNFMNSGHVDLAKKLMDARNKYRLLQETYFGKKTPNAIKNLVDKENRKIPKNMMEVLDQQSIPMDRIKSQNPFAFKKSRQYSAKQNAVSNLKKLGYLAIGGPTVLGAFAGAPLLYNKLIGEE